MIQISAVIITFNEEKNICRCIDSLQDIADEILVVDSFSTDRTKEICEEKKIRFVQNTWEGYIEQKNFGNNLAIHDYILSIDADEALSEELRNSIAEIKRNWKFDGYEMNRLTNYCGKWIKHCGWYPDRKLRLFNKLKGKWEGYMIHEHIQLDEESSKTLLKGDLYHYSYYNISEHMIQANHFSDIAADVLFSGGKNAGLFKLFFSPIFRFIRDYFFKLGILDGYYGFIICQLSAHAVFLKYSKLRQLWLFNKNER
ncbi:glycosyltransferase family 2 protein [Bacteroidota bacterium]